MTPYILKTSQTDQPPQAEPHFTLNYDAELNESQLEVVKRFHGPILVVAGAGSGKTRTLTYRVARMVESGIAPESILLLTFTRKAAQEMLRRASVLLDSRCEKVAGGTFHAFANITLRRYGKTVNLAPGFTIMDQGDTEDVVKLLIDRSGVSRKGKNFPKKNTVQGIFSKVVNKALTIEETLQKFYPGYIDYTADLRELYHQFVTYKLDHQLLDYDDLLVYTRRLLDEHEDIRRRLSDRYPYIMVDEYQDTNPVQARIVRLLAATHDNVMAVGDEAQSIYSFRGANYRNILDFPKQFPGTTIIKLEENFRSVQPILNVTNDIIKQAKESFRKHLFTRIPGGVRPVFIQARDEPQQSQFVAQRILELQDEGIPLSDMAVLFRSSFHSFDLELELNKRNIPFVKVGGLKFIEAAHIKDILAYMRLLANPLDSVSWHRVLLLIEGIGAKTATTIVNELQEQPDPFGWLTAFPKKTKYSLELQRLGATLKDILPLTPVEQIYRLREYYVPILHNVYNKDSEKREPDLEQLNIMAEQFRNLQMFLTEMTLEPPSRSIDGMAHMDNSDEDLLVLSTIHSAKGLEWHSVFVIWLADGRFPSEYAFDDDTIEEELRLLYVATTRAMRNLYLIYPIEDKLKNNYFSRPSRFLKKISPQYLDQWSLHEERDVEYEET